MKSFNLFGKVFSISDDRDTYNLLHKKYCENANQAYEEYTEKYRKLDKIEAQHQKRHLTVKNPTNGYCIQF